MKQRPFGFELSRRQFLSTLAVAGAATSCRQLPFDRRAFDVPARSAVALVPAADYQIDFADTMARGLALFQLDVRGRSVLLKPNMVEYESGTVINTHPLVVAGAEGELCQRLPRQIPDPHIRVIPVSDVNCHAGAIRGHPWTLIRLRWGRNTLFVSVAAHPSQRDESAASRRAGHIDQRAVGEHTELCRPVERPVRLSDPFDERDRSAEGDRNLVGN